MSCDIPNTDKFTLTIFLAIAERERELISIRTKAALQAAKARGKVLGTNRNLTKDGREQGQQASRQKAIDAYAGDSNYIKILRDSGMTYQEIATQLNSDGKTTRKGKLFQPMTVKRILDRQKA